MWAGLSRPLSRQQCARRRSTSPATGAGQVRQAYNLWPLYRKGITGAGETIVIVDSFGSPTIKHDLGVFDAAYKLVPPRPRSR